MLISPSIASSDLLHLEEETVFAAHHFGQIHIDIEDGTIVPNITMGMRYARKSAKDGRTRIGRFI